MRDDYFIFIIGLICFLLSFSINSWQGLVLAIIGGLSMGWGFGSFASDKNKY